MKFEMEELAGAGSKQTRKQLIVDDLEGLAARASGERKVSPCRLPNFQMHGPLRRGGQGGGRRVVRGKGPLINHPSTH